MAIGVPPSCGTAFQFNHTLSNERCHSNPLLVPWSAQSLASMSRAKLDAAGIFWSALTLASTPHNNGDWFLQQCSCLNFPTFPIREPLSRIYRSPIWHQLQIPSSTSESILEPLSIYPSAQLPVTKGGADIYADRRIRHVAVY